MGVFQFPVVPPRLGNFYNLTSFRLHVKVFFNKIYGNIFVLLHNALLSNDFCHNKLLKFFIFMLLLIILSLEKCHISIKKYINTLMIKSEKIWYKKIYLLEQERKVRR